jgi:DNA topoisomerase I
MRASSPVGWLLVNVMARPAPESVAAARRAGLRYSRDDRPGITRHRAGRGFTYRDPRARTIRARRTLERIRAIAVPPAWTDVWICVDSRGHIQATGRDARGRKQYRYHADYRTRRDAAKFEQLLAFGRALPRIRRRVARDLARRGSPREKILAASVRLLELTLIRVGNDEYARLNASFGLTTLRDRHAIVSGATIRFRFRGKGGKGHDVTIRDRRLARIVAHAQELPGQDLFEYVDDTGEAHPIRSEDVNDYLRDIAGAEVTAKIFRAWGATLLAVRALSEGEAADSPRLARREIVAAMEEVAQRLGNTAAIARGSYVHPAVLEAYAQGDLATAAPTEATATGAPAVPARRAEEVALIRLLERAARRRTPRVA